MARESSLRDPSGRIRFAVMIASLVAGVVWAFWPVLHQMVDRWSHDPRYSHGFLVPIFSTALLWMRRGEILGGPLNPSWWGIPILASGAVLQLAGARFYIPWLEAVAILPILAGVGVLAGGRRALRWSLPSIAFLFFMIPLPYRVEMGLGYPLQRVATLASNYALQTIGLPAVAEGNVILLGDVRIGVVEACNGLGMLFTFFAFAVATALVVERPPLDKMIIILSAVPTALAANIIRITATGFLHVVAGSELAEHVYHDLAGWLMMPLAVGALWVELAVLSHLFVFDTPPERNTRVGLVDGLIVDHPVGRGTHN